MQLITYLIPIDIYIMGQSASTPTTVTGVNEIPPPQFDANANAPPQKQHDLVIDFVRVSLKSIIRHKEVGWVCITGEGR